MRRDFKIFLGALAVLVALLIAFVGTPLSMFASMYDDRTPYASFAEECAEKGGQTARVDGIIVCNAPGQPVTIFGG